MKIAILRLTDVIAGSHDGRAAETRLQARLQELERAANDAHREATKAEAEARQHGERTAVEERTKRAAQLRRAAEHQQNEAGIEIDQLRQKLLHEVLGAVRPIVNGLAEERELDLVQIVPNPGIAWYNPSLDITDEVIRRFDAAGGHGDDDAD